MQQRKAAKGMAVNAAAAGKKRMNETSFLLSFCCHRTSPSSLSVSPSYVAVVRASFCCASAPRLLVHVLVSCPSPPQLPQTMWLTMDSVLGVQGQKEEED